MSWLDANEVFLMEVVSRDRAEELRLAIDLAKETADSGPQAPRADREYRSWWCRRASVARA